MICIESCRQKVLCEDHKARTRIGCPVLRPNYPNRPNRPNHPNPLQEFYETTLQALEQAKNDRLFFKTSIKLASLWFKKEQFGRLSHALRELRK